MEIPLVNSPRKTSHDKFPLVNFHPPATKIAHDIIHQTNTMYGSLYGIKSLGRERNNQHVFVPVLHGKNYLD